MPPDSADERTARAENSPAPGSGPNPQLVGLPVHWYDGITSANVEDSSTSLPLLFYSNLEYVLIKNGHENRCLPDCFSRLFPDFSHRPLIAVHSIHQSACSAPECPLCISVLLDSDGKIVPLLPFVEVLKAGFFDMPKGSEPPPSQLVFLFP